MRTELRRPLRSEALPAAIVDTNIVFSGVPGDAPTSAARVVAAMLDGSLTFILSPTLLDEYERVLWRQEARRRHRLSGDTLAG